ncbi:hypothetical protein ACFQ60_23920 [Streptomyces zhihengii]
MRLLNDPADSVRRTATRTARLPARVLAGLLHDRATASDAVTNPAIPVPVLHRILAATADAVEAAEAAEAAKAAKAAAEDPAPHRTGTASPTAPPAAQDRSR